MRSPFLIPPGMRYELADDLQTKPARGAIRGRFVD
jgi:hypothetical protein